MEPIFKAKPYTNTANPAGAATGIKGASNTSTTSDSQKSSPVKPDADRYTPEEKHTSIGLYHIDADENGKHKIFFDAPKQTDDNKAAPSDTALNSGEEASKSDAVKKKTENKKEELCHGSTDKVDREIKKLKQKKKELESRLRTEKDETRAEALEKELAQVEKELSQKDNDTYRRQHTVFS